MTRDEEVDPLVDFRDRLQELFVLLRRPTYRGLEAHADRDGRVLRPSTISGLLNGPGMPRWSTVETFVRASARHAQAHQIRLTPQLLDLDRWHRDYRTMENALADQAADRERITGRAVPARRGVIVPAQLPADVQSFTGRIDHLAGLGKLLPDLPHSRNGGSSPGTVIISAIDGTAGVGKTTLAVHWAHQIRDRFPDGQLYVNLRGFDSGGKTVDSATAVRGFLDALDVPGDRIPADRDAQAALYRSLLADKRMLIVLDNARDTVQVRPLLPGATGCLVVVTSRNQLTSLVAAHGAHPITLDLLTRDEARELLARRLGAERIAAEEEATEQIIARCARLPLALTLVAAHAAMQPHLTLTALADQLRDTRDRWQTLSGDDPSTDAQTVFSWSYETLGPETAALFRLLGLLPGSDITVAAAASLSATPAEQVRPLLAELTRASLITESVPGRFTLHDLLRAYATGLCRTTDPAPVRKAATERLLDHYVHAMHTANEQLNRPRDPIVLDPPRPGVDLVRFTDAKQANGWMMTEQAVMIAAVDLAATAGFEKHACLMAKTLWTFLDRRGSWHENVALQRVALAAAQQIPDDPSWEAHARRLLADSAIRLGQFDDAQTELGHALDLYKQVGDQAAQAHTHLDLAMMWERSSQHTEALEHAEQSLILWRAVDHRQWQARALNAVGWIQSQLGAHEDALRSCQESLSLLQALGDRQGQAAALDSLGYVHDRLGHHPEALTCYENALEIRRDLGDRYPEASTLTRVGDTHLAAGNPSAARTAYEQALAILTDFDHPDAASVRTKLDALTKSPPE